MWRGEPRQPRRGEAHPRETEQEKESAWQASDATTPAVENQDLREVKSDHGSEDSEPSDGSGGAETHQLTGDDGGAGFDTREGRRAREARRSRGRSSWKERRSSKRATHEQKRRGHPRQAVQAATVVKAAAITRADRSRKRSGGAAERKGEPASGCPGARKSVQKEKRSGRARRSAERAGDTSLDERIAPLRAEVRALRER